MKPAFSGAIVKEVRQGNRVRGAHPQLRVAALRDARRRWAVGQRVCAIAAPVMALRAGAGADRVLPAPSPPKDTLLLQVRAYVVGSKEEEEAAGGGADCHSQKHGHWIVDTPIANPSSHSADMKASRKSWGIDALGTVIAEVELHSGVVGVGISIGGEPACYIIENHLARFVEGQDVHNVELMWEQMFKATLNYGRKGLPIQAISAVDLALWDAL